MPPDVALYAVSYGPCRRGENDQIDVWPAPLTLGEPLPVLPLWLRDVENPVRVDLEAGYTEARQRCAIA